MFLPRKIIERKLHEFLKEDLGQGDITTSILIPENIKVKAEIIAKENGVVAGIEEAKILLESLGVKAKELVKDGQKVSRGKTIMKIEGDARTILTAERTLLNLLSRMSGIATATNKIIEKVKSTGYKVRIACTRKTAPGLEYFDKKAVLLGGGDTHRLHLDDMILIKDNHIAIIGDVKRAVKIAREKASFSKKIEVEASSVDDAVEAAKAGADIIMLDNFAPKDIKRTVQRLEKEKLRKRVLIEASGRINERNILEFADSGVDIISLGSLTHSVKALDISLEITKLTTDSKM
ncbi:carboxylating nicotinate-nucleotide diphosphorylase [Candidatus Bathyarchaeota archaeon]|nr:MAG: carboxylating nicotinate-nucleotide diphosphorylase [Candidatus Bathyarchaeota archaeon]